MNRSSQTKLRVVVLAAGFSSRLGRPKALAQLRGASLLSRTLELACHLDAGAVVVVIPAGAARYRICERGVRSAPLKVEWAINRRRSEGLSSSVRRGIVAARYASAVLVLPVDLAHLKRTEVQRLIRRWRSTPRRLVARKLADTGAIPLILPKWLFRRAMTVTGDIGLRRLIADLPAEQRVFVDLPSATPDVDTPEALAEARRHLRPGG
jgi:molybdenum cofactor cytidylyltransferase